MYNARIGFLTKIQEEDLPVSHYKTVFKDKTWSKAQMFRTVSHNTVEAFCDFQYFSDKTRLFANFDILIQEKV